MELQTAFGYIGALLTGIVLGILGGGGALLSIPVLVYFFHVEAGVATGYSLFLIGITALSGAVRNILMRNVDFRLALWYGVPSLFSVYAMRRFIMPAVPDIIYSGPAFTLDKNHLILFFLSAVMLLVGRKMIQEERKETPVSTGAVDYKRMILYSLLIGSFLGMVGAGGGFLMTPVLIYFGRLKMKKAVGTSLFLVSCNSFIGFLGDLGGNYPMNWSLLLSFSGFSVAGVFAGVYLANFVDESRLKKAFGWFMLVLAATIVIKEGLR